MDEQKIEDIMNFVTGNSFDGINIDEWILRPEEVKRQLKL